MNQRDQLRDRMFTRRALLLGAGQVALFSTLVGRLYYLQVIDADRYATLAEDNRINLKLLTPPRGRILDRYGQPLALNRQNYRVVIVHEQARDIDATLDALSLLIDVSDADRHRVWREIKRKRSFVPVVVRDDMSWDEVAKVEINAPDLPGISIDVGQSRYYPHTEAVGHILGYVGAVSEAELKSGDDPLLELPDFRIGKSGIEKTYDTALRGTAGASQVEVNAVGRIVRELSRDDGQSGRDVQLTIDISLQEYARERIGDESAGLVLMDIHSGDVLAMVSAPAFDPNVFSSGVSARDWEDLLANPKTPLTNKAIAGQYSPGSTFKMTTALAALEAGVITPQTEISCSGHYDFGNSQYHCWKKTGHGMVDLQRAIKASCDVFFYETAHRVGIDRLAQMARRLGYGSALGIDIPGERPGLIPDRDWKQATLGQSWAQGETLSCGIGQSYIAATPLQLATMASRIANGGYAVVPRLTRAIGGKPVPVPGPFPSVGVNPANLALVVKAMGSVCNEPGGTGYEFRIKDPGLEMAGKTGSAQTRRITQAERDKGLKDQRQLPWRERDNALFVGFAPVQQPRYACAIVVEHGAHGAWVEPIVRDLLTEIQKRDIAAGRVAAVPKSEVPG